MRRQRKLRLQILLVLGSVVFALVLSEVTLRVVSPGAFRVWKPGLFAMFHPDPEVVAGVRGDSRFSINSEGMRAAEPPRGDAYRILAVGGSTTECLFLDQDAAWPRLLEERLSTPARRVFVGNVGKSGQAARQHLLALTHLLPQHPDYQAAVVLIGVNDVAQALGRESVLRGPFEPRDYFKAFMVFPDRFASPEDAPFYERTHLYRLVGPAIPFDPPSKALVQDVTGSFYDRFRAIRAAAPRVAELPDLSDALDQYRRYLEGMVLVAAQRGVRLVLVTQPVLWQKDMPPELERLLWFGWQVGSTAYYTAAALAQAMDRYNAETLAVCRARGVECVDLAARLPRDTSVFYDDCHFNESGARQVAAALAEHFESHGPLEGGR